jgi:hypothetical protein
MNWLMYTLIGAACVSGYWLWVRPLLKETPSLKEFYAEEESLLEAAKLKFAGIKQKLTTAIIFIASIIVMLYDQLAPLALQSGVDVTSLSDKIPPKAWPFILMAAAGLLGYFRRLSDKRAAAEAAALEAEAAKTDLVAKG